MYVLAISLGKKCWQTDVEIQIWLSQWGDPTCTKSLMCFLLGRVRGLEFSSCWCSQRVCNGLTPSSQRSTMFQCVPEDVSNNKSLLSHLICPKLSSIHLYRWVKGETWYFHLLGIETSIGGSFQSFSIAAYDIKMTHCK